MKTIPLIPVIKRNFAGKLHTDPECIKCGVLLTGEYISVSCDNIWKKVCLKCDKRGILVALNSLVKELQEIIKRRIVRQRAQIEANVRVSFEPLIKAEVQKIISASSMPNVRESELGQLIIQYEAEIRSAILERQKICCDCGKENPNPNYPRCLKCWRSHKEKNLPLLDDSKYQNVMRTALEDSRGMKELHRRSIRFGVRKRR